jgi:hypothetical protein
MPSAILYKKPPLWNFQYIHIQVSALVCWVIKVWIWRLGTPASALTLVLEVRTETPLDLDSTLADRAISYFSHPATSPLTGSAATISLLPFAECVGRNNTSSRRPVSSKRSGGGVSQSISNYATCELGKWILVGRRHRNYYEPRSILSCAYGRVKLHYRLWNLINESILFLQTAISGREHIMFKEPWRLFTNPF